MLTFLLWNLSILFQRYDFFIISLNFNSIKVLLVYLDIKSTYLTLTDEKELISKTKCIYV